MAGIEATISLRDNSSPVINKIITILNRMDETLNAIQSHTNTIASSFRKIETTTDGATDAVDKTNKKCEKLDTILKNTNNSCRILLNIKNKIGSATRSNAKAQARHNEYLRGATTEANQLLGSLKAAVSIYSAYNAGKGVLALADAVSMNRARLGIVNELNGSLYETAQLEEMIYESSMRSRGSYLDTAKVVSGLGIRAADAFGNVGEIVQFTEVLNKMGAISGSSANEVTSALYQINQAMGSGKFQGDEFRSVSENLPLALQAVAKYMNVSVGTLKKLSKEGKITADVFKNAILSMSNEVDDRFKKMPITWSQVWNIMKNYMIKASDAILLEISEITQSDRFIGFAQAVGDKFKRVIDIIHDMFVDMKKGIAYVYDNWSKFRPIITSVTIALGIYSVAIKGCLVVSALYSYFQAIMAARIARVNGMLLVQRSQLYGLTAAMLSCPWVWLVGGLSILIGTFVALTYSTHEYEFASIDVWGTIKNVAVVAAENIKSAWASLCAYVKPAIQSIGDVFNQIADWIVSNWDTISSVISTVVGAFVWLGQTAFTVGSWIAGGLKVAWEFLCVIWDVLCFVGQLIIDNAGWVSTLILNVATAIGTVVLTVGALCGIILIAIGLWLTISVAIATVKAVMSLFTIATWKAVAANIAAAVSGWAASAPLLFWVVVIGILIVVIAYLIQWIADLCGSSVSATGLICGAFMWLAGAVWDIIVTIWNGILTFFDAIINQILGIIEWFINAFNGGFDSFGSAVANLLGNIISWFLDLGCVVTKIIDAIFGTDWTAGLKSLRNKVISWGSKNSNAITIERDVLSRNASLGYVDANEWASAGYKFGENIGESFSNIQSKLEGLGNFGDITSKLGGIGVDGDITKKLSGLVQTKDPSSSANFGDDIAKALGNNTSALDDISTNTGKIADNTGDSLSKSSEDLKYLRELAEREAINKYTLTDLNLNLSNVNNINSEQDGDNLLRRFLGEVYNQVRPLIGHPARR